MDISWAGRVYDSERVETYEKWTTMHTGVNNLDLEPKVLFF